MNKDELSELRISHRARAVHTPQPMREFSKEKKALPSRVYLYINTWRLSISTLYIGHLELLRKAIWLSGRFTSCPVPWSHLYYVWAGSTVSTEESYENAVDTTEDIQVALKEMLAARKY